MKISRWPHLGRPSYRPIYIWTGGPWAMYVRKTLSNSHFERFMRRLIDTFIWSDRTSRRQFSRLTNFYTIANTPRANKCMRRFRYFTNKFLACTYERIRDISKSASYCRADKWAEKQQSLIVIISLTQVEVFVAISSARHLTFAK